MTNEPRTTTLTDEELLKVYTAGFVGGGSTILGNSGTPTSLVELIPRLMADEMLSDPAVRDTILRAIRISLGHEERPPGGETAFVLRMSGKFGGRS